MPPTNLDNTFTELRKRYTYFTYEGYEYAIGRESLDIKFSFNLSGTYTFTPTLRIPLRKFFDFNNIPPSVLENIIFHIGMVELISYWKAACPPLVIVKPFKLNEQQVNWWKNIYFSGLGEFFYLNGIHTDVENFMEIRSESNAALQKFSIPLDDSYIVPVGGGKDSVVTLELLKSNFAITPLVINQRKATAECIQTAGFSSKESIEIFRTIDPLLLELNKQGFLNGHTPFSALLAFVSLLAGVVSRKKNIALSNEASANETTVIGQEINHQYSKSFQFEKDFREYVAAYINDGLNYFSFLRPLHEIQIACLFSKFPQYYNIFKSCNVGSKTDIWCCNCPKCLFSFIILSPFIPSEILTGIFGENLLDKASLIPVFHKLTGSDPVKPFECIGTVEEVNIALAMTLNNYKGALPALLKIFAENPLFEKFRKSTADKCLKTFDHENFLTAKEFRIIKQALSC